MRAIIILADRFYVASSPLVLDLDLDAYVADRVFSGTRVIVPRDKVIACEEYEEVTETFRHRVRVLGDRMGPDADN